MKTKLLLLIITITLVNTVNAQLTLQDSLIAYYPFNANANDESGNGNDGTHYGEVVLTEDRYGNAENAYSFDGSDDKIDFGNISDSTSHTYSIWFKTNGIPSSSQVVYSNWGNATDKPRRCLRFDSNLELRHSNRTR